jgi:hydroxymethylbilane synthase
VIAAIPARHDPRDAVLTVDGRSFAELPAGAVLATASFRRRCQFLHARPDLDTRPVRGNVDTRVRKLREGQFEALVLALAGVERLGIASVEVRPVPVTTCLPAVGQGALALETRADDASTREVVGVLADPAATDAVEAERAFLRRLGGGCLAPATAFAVVESGGIRIDAVVGDPDGRELLRDACQGRAADGRVLGEALAVRLLDAGAGEILARARREAAGGAGA